MEDSTFWDGFESSLGGSCVCDQGENCSGKQAAVPDQWRRAKAGPETDSGPPTPIRSAVASMAPVAMVQGVDSLLP